MSEHDFPDVGTKWRHVQSQRICKVVGCRIVRMMANGSPVGDPLPLVEFRYLRMDARQRRQGPMQTLNLADWRAVFTEKVE